jgi:AraC family transcriptional regulator
MQVLERGQYSGDVIEMCGATGVIASVTCYNGETFNGRRHYHDNAHISLVLHGACVERKRVSYDRTPGKITYYSAREPHQIMHIRKPSRHINLEIEDSFFTKYNVSDEAIHTAITKNPDAKFMMVKMYKELLAGDDFSNTSIQMLLLRLVHKTRKLLHEEGLPQWVKTVKALLYDKWDETVTLHDLSVAANVHPVTVSKYFPQYFSCTLGEYMRKLKIEKALGLIKASPRSLTEIAYECGFADQSHFIRVFKEFTGYLPARYQSL